MVEGSCVRQRIQQGEVTHFLLRLEDARMTLLLSQTSGLGGQMATISR
jgi:hypothetical protein